MSNGAIAMPFIRCSACDRSLKIPDDIKSRTVRCPCGQKINLDEEPTSSRTPDQAPPPLPAPADCSVDHDDALPPRSRPRKKRLIRGLIPLLVLTPVSGVLLILAPFFKVAAWLTAMTGAVVLIVATISVFRLGSKKGLRAEFEDVPAYMQGGGALIVYQVKYAVLFPRVLACWVFLEFFSLAVLVTGAVIYERTNWPAKENPSKPAPGKEVANVIGDPDLDKLFADFNDPFKRGEAANKLAKLKPNEHQAKVAGRLAKLTTQSDISVRQCAVKALGTWATPKEVPDLIRCFEDSWTRVEAIDAMRALGPAVRPTAEEALLPFLKGRGQQPGPLANAAILVLKDIGTQRSVPELKEVAATAMPALTELAKVGPGGNCGAEQVSEKCTPWQGTLSGPERSCVPKPPSRASATSVPAAVREARNPSRRPLPGTARLA